MNSLPVQLKSIVFLHMVIRTRTVRLIKKVYSIATIATILFGSLPVYAFTPSGVGAGTDEPKGNHFAIDFIAAEPTTYDHSIGGGFYDDRIIGTNVVEELNGGTFKEGDRVSFFDAIEVTGTYAGTASLHMVNKFGNVSVNGHPAGFNALGEVVINTGDSANLVNDNESVSDVTAAISGPDLVVEFNVAGLEPGEVLVIRVDVIIYNDITGVVQNAQVQSQLAGATVLECTSGNCTVGGSQTIPLKNAEEILPGDIVIVKETVPADDTMTEFLMNGGLGEFSLVGNGSSQAFGPLEPGSYSVAESELSGWSLSNLSCTGDLDGGNVIDLETRSVSIDLDEGEYITCTFVNELDTGTLTVLKNVDVNNDGDLDDPEDIIGATDWYWDWDTTDDEWNIPTGNTVTLEAGMYTVSEEMKEGYHVDEWYCGDGEPGTGESFEVEIVAGQDLTCTFTNAANTGSLELIKSSGNGINPEDWSFIIDGPGDAYDFGSEEEGVSSGWSYPNLPLGTYTITEIGPENYHFESGSGDADCGFDENGVLTVVIDENGDSISCTFVNAPDPGSISGYKWEDINGNGEWNDGEPTVDGWQIFIDKDGDGILDDEEQSDYTSDGSYSFDGLLPGWYTVCEVDQEGWNRTYPGENPGENCHPATEIAPGGAVENVNFGNFECATITGMKWEDMDGDGVMDPGDLGLSGWNINLSGPESYMATTLSDGTYSFTVCSAGEYTISEQIPDADIWYQTYPSDPGTHVIGVTSGGAYPDNDFGNTQYVSVIGHKYEDIDGDGILDPEDIIDGLIGWSINLYDAATDMLIDSYPTAVDGVYRFTDLLAGVTYYLVEEVQTGWVQTFGPNPGFPGTIINFFTPESGEVYGDEEGELTDFANFELIDVKACKVVDLDGELGTWDDRVIYIGWEVSLIVDGVPVDTQQTGTNPGGCYVWEDLEPGHVYGVSETLPPGWNVINGGTEYIFGDIVSGETYSHTFINERRGKIIIEKQTDPDGQLQSFDFDPSWSEDNFTLADGQEHDGGWLDHDTYEVTEYLPFGWAVESIVCDDDNSGPIEITPDFGTVEIALEPGETVRCTFTNDAIEPTLLLTKIVEKSYNGTAVASDFSINVSGDDGSSYLGNTSGTVLTLEPDVVYTITEEDKFGYELDRYEGNCSSSGTLSLDYGDQKECVLVNKDLPGEIHGMKYEDLNGNGEKDEGESGLGGWIIFLDEDQDGVLDLDERYDTTDGTGYYSFEDLAQGTYYVREMLQEEWIPTESPGSVDVGNEEVVTGVNFGNFLPGTIEGIKYHDRNADSNFGEDEQGDPANRLNGWDIVLYDGEWMEYGRMLTGEGEMSDGMFQFGGLWAGQYYLCEELQEGWIQTEPMMRRVPGDVFGDLVQHPSDGRVCYSINIRSSDAVDAVFGNYQVPELVIEKTNDSIGEELYAGDAVMYTITVTALYNDVDDVCVFDLPPAGFTVREASRTIMMEIEIPDGPKSECEKAYDGGYGGWYLGDMMEGETRTLTYWADISETQAPGTYPDLAWAEGVAKDGNPVTAYENSDIPDKNDTFVGSEVVVIAPAEEPAGVVLGASTVLVETGQNILAWVIGAIGLIVIALLGMAGIEKKSKKVMALALGFVGTAFLAVSPTLAANIGVDIHQPQTPMHNSDFTVSFVAMDTKKGRDMTVSCQVSPHGMGTYAEYDTFSELGVLGQATTINKDCVVSDSVLTGDGKYDFIVVVSVLGETDVTSRVVSVEYDVTVPSDVEEYDREEIGTCTYRITFTTADDGQTTEVEIYRSTEEEFEADASTYIATVEVGPGETGEYVDVLTDCNTPVYYVVRAVDDTGNTSGFVGDTIVTTEVVLVEGAAAGGAAAGVVAGAEAGTEGEAAEGEEGEVLGEESDEEGDGETSELSEEEDKNGNGIPDDEEGVDWNKVLTYIGVAGLIGLLGLGLNYVRNRRREI